MVDNSTVVKGSGPHKKVKLLPHWARGRGQALKGEGLVWVSSVRATSHL